MLVDVSEILKEYGGKIPVSGELHLEDTDFLGEEYHFTAPVSITGELSNNGTSLILRAKCDGEVGVHCARCRKPLTVPISFEIDETLSQGEAEDAEEDTDMILFTGHQIDLNDIAANSFLMSISGKFLCKEDCKGLCPHCGADLNQSECGCNRETIDPRWAALAEMMESSDDQ